jgi:hypothetical protein
MTTETVHERITRLERELEEARNELPGPLKVASSFNRGSNDASVEFDADFDSAGDMYVEVSNKNGGYATTWINQEGARQIVAHLQRALGET